MSPVAAERRAAIVAQAVAAVAAVDDADNRALILANLVPQMPNDERDRVLIQAIEATTDRDWPFARLDRRREPGLGDVQPAGGAGEVLFLGDRDEVLELA